MRLSQASLDRLPSTVARFDYDRNRQQIGIVHLGIGAFHRAHQALYTDRAMDAGDSDWAIIGVSLRSEAVSKQLNPQDGLYSITERGTSQSVRIVGAVRGAIAATDEAGFAAAVAAIAAPTTRIVSLTVTEKGYDLDLSCGQGRKSAEHGLFDLLAKGLAERRRSGLAGLTLLSCDNLSANGRRLRDALTVFLATHEPDLLDWFSGHCACPSTMVDRIVPATTEKDRRSVQEVLGLADQAAVVTEPFSQWVIEDQFADRRPSWEVMGAQFVSDVLPYETAKLRMLNGAHSALAYLGLERGHRFVHEAMTDPVLRPVIDALLVEASTSFTPAAGQNLDAYSRGLVERLANPSLHHRLDQIATDGSRKIQQRWLRTLADRRSRGEPSPAVMAALAAWIRHVRSSSPRVDDPLAPRLAALWASAGQTGIVSALFSDRGLFAGGLSEDQQHELTSTLCDLKSQQLF